jgi:hypothetical protein
MTALCRRFEIATFMETGLNKRRRYVSQWGSHRTGGDDGG